MSNATSYRTQAVELPESGAPFTLSAVPIDPKVIAKLAEVRVPIPQSVLLGWVDVPPGDPRGATNHAVYLTPGGYAYRVTTYLGDNRSNGADSN
ncbi:hypothetical protein [Streptomyces sp. NRRL S-340]|uniref:hypothetical protein n=1 Tax=Streptomyces sp. NRRL S-340 TaxID=1463901 RepID=UPI00055AC057|nr:hypothetical protein [Streptomyces sp. NRRL S-340]